MTTTPATPVTVVAPSPPSTGPAQPTAQAIPVYVFPGTPMRIAMALLPRLRSECVIALHADILWIRPARSIVFRPYDEVIRPELWVRLARVRIGFATAPDQAVACEPTKAKVTDVAEALAAAAINQLAPTGYAPRKLPTPTDPHPTQEDPRDLVVFRDGVLNVATMTFDPQRRWFVTSALDVDWSEASSAPEPIEWLAALGRQWPTDPESIRALQMFVGYSLASSTHLEKGCIIRGPTRSFKGGLGRAILALHGVRTDDAWEDEPREISGVGGCAAKFSKFSSEFAYQPLLGKNFVLFPDARIGETTDVGAITENCLEMIAGDTVQINRKHLSMINAKLAGKVMLLTNVLPRFVDASGAAANRFIVLETTRSFLGSEDSNLKRKVLAELPGIARWAVEGLRDLRQTGRLIQPASSAGLVAQMLDNANPLRDFILDRGVRYTPDGGTKPKVLYQQYRCYAHTAGIRPVAKARFFSELQATIPQLGEPGTRRIDGTPTWVFALQIDEPCGGRCSYCAVVFGP